MSEESSTLYKDGDIVWVKLGPSWWPGEVKNMEELDETIVEFKKKPLVVVKFFDEDTYEYVRKWSNIFPYNCDKKNDFIKKGMAAYRAKVPHMEKFPKDVSNAEVLINGNPNILSEPIFLPEKKTNYVAEVFGTPSPKGKAKDKKPRSKKSQDIPYVTHRRFLGFDDYKAYICVQYPGKDRTPGDEEDEEVILINQEPTKTYDCNVCPFKTKRLEVMLLHTKSHIQGVYVPSTPKRMRKSIKQPKVVVEMEVRDTPPVVTNIRSDLLAEWEVSDEDLEETIDTTLNTSSIATESSTSIADETEENLNDSERSVSTTNIEEAEKSPVENDDEKMEESVEKPASKENSEVSSDKEVEMSEKIDDSKKLDIHQAIKSCFDFDEDDEDTIIPTATTTGRKIPRVIPIADRKKSKDVEDEIEAEPEEESEEPVNKEEILKTSESFNQKAQNNEIDDAFKELMETTSVPELPEVQNSLKCEQNFHSTRTIKFPDKQEFADSKAPNIDKTEESATKLTNPKKRFVKSFEEFENEIRLKRLRKEEDEKQSMEDMDDEKNEKTETLLENIPKIADLKCQIMSKIIEESKVQEDKKEKIVLKIVKSSKHHRKTKDRKSTEEQMPSYSSTVYKSSLHSRRSGTAKDTKEPEDLIDIEPIRSKLGDILLKTSPSTRDRKPRSKLMDSYLSNDKSETEEAKADHQKSESPAASTSLHEKVPETKKEPIVETKSVQNEPKVAGKANVQTVPPKKNKWSRRMSHPKKNRHLFDFQETSSTESPVTEPSSTADKQESESITNNDAVEDVASKPEEPEHHEVSSHVLAAEDDLGAKNDSNIPPPITNNEDVVEQNDVENHQAQEPCSKEEAVTSETNVVEDELTLEIDTRDDTSINTFSLSTKDELSPIEKATVFLPEDAICSPPQKTKKRKSKKSEDEQNLTDFYLFEKRRRSDDSDNQKVVDEKKSVKETDVPVLKVVEDTDSTEAKNEDVLEEIQGKKLDEVEENERVEPEVLPHVEEQVEVQGIEVESEHIEQEIELEGELQIEETVVEEKEVVQPIASDELIEDAHDETVTAEEVDVVKNDCKFDKNFITEDIIEEVVSFSANLHSSKEKEIKDVQVCEEVSTEECNNEIGIEMTENIIEEPVVQAKDEEVIQEDNKVETIIEDSVESEEVITDKGAESHEIIEEKVVEDFSPKKTEEIVSEEDQKIEEKVVNNSEDVGLFTKPRAVDDVKDDKEAEKTNEKDSQASQEEHRNELEVELDNSSDGFRFSIQTNLSNFSSREEISAIALATLAEMKSDENGASNVPAENVESKSELVQKMQSFPEPELVSIEGNLTVVSEKDLADGQVEITPDQVISSKKQMILTNFSADFSDSTNDSTSTSEVSEPPKSFDPRGTEFTSKAMTKDFKSCVGNKQGRTYERYELIDILEGTDSDKKNKELLMPKKSIVDDFCDFEDHIPPQIVCAKKLKLDKEKELQDEALKKQEEKPERRGRVARERPNKSSVASTTSKLLERLNESKISPKPDAKQDAYVPKPRTSRSKSGGSTNKPLILTEKTVKPVNETQKPAAVKSKQLMTDIEDVEAFVIHKELKKEKTETKLVDPKSAKSKVVTAAGKAKILQQTIITPAGEIIQPAVAVNSVAQSDDNIFDINSMPIVLSDEILTPESIEKMPIVISTEPTVSVAANAPQERLLMVSATGKKPLKGKILTKITTAPPALLTQTVVVSKSPGLVPKQTKVAPRILQTVGNKIKQPTLITGTTKPGKYIIVPQSAALPMTSKTIAKKMPSLKKTSIPSGVVTTAPAEVTGNKIMILTNQQGQQQRLLLTPAQQKIIGYHPAGTKIAKTIVKGNALPKTIVQGIPTAVEVKAPGLITQKIIVSTSGIPTNSTTEQLLMTPTPPLVRSTKLALNKRPVTTVQKPLPNPTKPSKTILLKGQTVKKMQSTEEDLEKQVKEQLEAIRASSAMQFAVHSKAAEAKSTPKITSRRSYNKKTEPKTKNIAAITEVPPLVPKSDHVATTSYVPIKKTESSQVEQKLSLEPPALVVPESKPERPLNQLVIQDAVGNQTTITEGQILALPSETVDGQPQSYMLVTLDESGNLTPLNNEALMSLDPNLTGDLSNMVLQIEQSAVQQSLAQPATVKTNKINEPPRVHNSEMIERPIVPSLKTIEIPVSAKQPEIVPEPAQMVRSVVPSTNGEPGQQLIISGDPVATQKFLESLSEGTTDLANILANAEGNSILIQADGQQILINTNSENLLSVNNGSVNEGGGNPVFATQPNKSQDILAAALADTDVFQQDQPIQNKLTSQLSPNNTLYPMNVGNVLETSLTLSSPIMTPLEVPSTNSKKIPDDEADILTQVPKNVDLPITITDPNISQTVSNQQIGSLLPADLPTNLELSIPMVDPSISTSKEMNSPYNHYSLPSLEESVDMSQKTFSSSMPLLNEDVIEESVQMNNKSLIEDASIEVECRTTEEVCTEKSGDCMNARDSFLEEDDDEEDDGRFTLGGEICSSLSEPPPEMFDLPEVNLMSKNNISSLQSTPEPSSKDEDTTDLSSTLAESSNDSCEIPVQPRIVAKSQNLEAFGSD